MKRIAFLIGLIVVSGTTLVCGEQAGSSQNVDIKSSEVRVDKIKIFVDGFETYAQKIIDDYKKEVEGIEAKYKAEKYNKMMDGMGQYFRDANFNMREWLLIQEEFDKRYEVTKSDYDNLGIDGAYGTVRHYLEENLPQSLFTVALDIVSDRNYRDAVIRKYIFYIKGSLMDIYNRGGSINEENKLKIADAMTKILKDKTASEELRTASAELLAGYLGKNEKVVRVVLEILSDPKENEQIKSKMLFNISRFGIADDVRIREKILDIIKDKNTYSSEIFSNSLKVATRTHDKEASKILLDILQNTDDEKLFKDVRNSLQEYDDKDIIKAVLKNYNRFGEEDFLFLWKEDVLIEIINEGPTEYLPLAIKALSENTPRDPNNPVNVLEALGQQLYHPDPKIKIASINAIKKFAKIGNDEVRKKVIGILNTAEKNEKNKDVMNEIVDSIKSLEK